MYHKADIGLHNWFYANYSREPVLKYERFRVDLFLETLELCSWWLYGGRFYNTIIYHILNLFKMY